MVRVGYAFILLLLMLAACGDPETGLRRIEPEETQKKEAARTVVERGPVKATLEVTPAQARLSDEPVLTLTIEAEEGVQINKPPFGESLGAFLIRDFHEPLPEVLDNRRIIRQIYTLEPTDTGSLSIYPIRFTFVDNRPDGDGQEHDVETDGLTLEVASALETEAPSLADLKPAAGPLALPAEKSRAWIYLLGAAGVLIAGFFLVRAWRRKEPVPLEKKLTPKEIAFLEFKRLLEEGWIEADIKLFYVELTGIVRRYIERTTGVRAPEQTTEEFLQETSRKAVFPEEERTRLQSFLEAADQVKFAAFEPGKKEIEASFERAKLFVGIEGEGAVS